MKKLIFLALGSFSFIMGFIGIFLPLIPTTPFFLLTAFCYLRSSEKLYNWLINHKVYGIYVKNYLEHRAITKKAKITSLFMLWFTMGLNIIIFVKPMALKFLLFFIASAVTYHILNLKTLSNKNAWFFRHF